MQYNQPYGVTDPNAPYVNGDPSVGRQGSIPPAASVEYDQREIVAVIQWAFDHGYVDYAAQLCAAPSNADLTQLLKAIFGIMNSQRLLAPKTYYVDPTLGNDANDGLTAGAPFKTLSRAANAATVYNLNGFTVTINCAHGLYTQAMLPAVNGSGAVNFVGDNASPSSCTIHANSGPAVECMGVGYGFSGFRYESDATDTPGARPGSGVWCVPGGLLNLYGTNEFGYCADTHINAFKGTIAVQGTIRVMGNCNAHMFVTNNGLVYLTGNPFPALVIPAAVTCNSFAYSNNTSVLNVHYSSISGAANVTGYKYNASMNGVIDSQGGGVNYLPGNIAGIQSTGGQYV